LLKDQIVENLRYSASIRSKKAIDLTRLEAYLNSALRAENSPINLKNNDTFTVSNIKHIGGGYIHEVYSFLLTYNTNGSTKNLPLILKVYTQNVDVICKSYRYDSELRLCLREWDAMKNLEKLGFSVPKAYFCELDTKYLDYPFLIMAQIRHTLPVDIIKENNGLATTLANLHTLEADWSQFKTIKPPQNECEFAKRLCSHFKKALYIEENQGKRYVESINKAINWIEANAEDNCCPKYSLIHGDANGGNVLFTDDSTVCIDWECVDIGDPAYDIGIAYHMIKFHCNTKDPDSAEEIAQQFISKYTKEAKIDIQSRLKFYEVVGVLRCAIMYNSILSKPVKAYQEQREKVLGAIPPLRMPLMLLAFPLQRVPFVAKQIGLDRNIDWLEYFMRFVKNNCQ
jgi:aminoglycoside phosphotransferase (APT) family kinase protein